MSGCSAIKTSYRAAYALLALAWKVGGALRQDRKFVRQAKAVYTRANLKL
jgi:hypothetical protein